MEFEGRFITPKLVISTKALAPRSEDTAMYLPKRRESGRPPRAGPGGPLVAAIAAGLILSTLGCTPGQYASQADKAAYAVIKQKQGLALGEPKPFDITYRPFSAGADKAADQGLLLRGKPIPQGNAPPRALSLDECLETAVCNSRSFQTRKEQLYTSALALANLRHDWSLVSGNLLANAGTSRTMRGDSTHSGTGEANLSFARKFASGGVLTLAAGLDAATNFLRISDTAFGSFLQTNLTQPLLRVRRLCLRGTVPHRAGLRLRHPGIRAIHADLRGEHRHRVLRRAAPAG